jgi:hypothetical protein
MRSHVKEDHGGRGRADDLRKIGRAFPPKTVEQFIREEYPEVVELKLLLQGKASWMS